MAASKGPDFEKQHTSFVATGNRLFYEEVMNGLSRQPRQLPSKYFYDATGDVLFQAIMNSPDYYLTRCEMEIFTRQTQRLVQAVLQAGQPFELIELGPGDCAKSLHLFKGLIEAGASFHYTPIDISEHVIRVLEKELPEKAPGIKVSGLTGTYMEMLEKVSSQSGGRKVVLCLGANIGNMLPADSYVFCRKLRQYLAPGDLAIIGFDLKKNPGVIRNAYNDRDGITSRFNLNLLTRMNRELHADFRIDCFEHYCNYDPETGACKSYLVCLEDMDVRFPGQTISLKKNECIWMEISQKYTPGQIDRMAEAAGFAPLQYLMDDKGWFVDVIWSATGNGAVSA